MPRETEQVIDRSAHNAEGVPTEEWRYRATLRMLASRDVRREAGVAYDRTVRVAYQEYLSVCRRYSCAGKAGYAPCAQAAEAYYTERDRALAQYQAKLLPIRELEKFHGPAT